MKLLVVLAIVLCVAQCRERDHKRQYLPPLPGEDPSPPRDDTKTRNNDASQISYHTKVRSDILNRRYSWEDLKSDVKYFVLNKLYQFKKVFDGNGWVNLSRLAAAWIEWLKEENVTEHSTTAYFHRT